MSFKDLDNIHWIFTEYRSHGDATFWSCNLINKINWPFLGKRFPFSVFLIQNLASKFVPWVVFVIEFVIEFLPKKNELFQPKRPSVKRILHWSNRGEPSKVIWRETHSALPTRHRTVSDSALESSLYQAPKKAGTSWPKRERPVQSEARYRTFGWKFLI